jgi:hypothetical protein
VSVSKHDWKNFQSQMWLGSCKPSYNSLMMAFDGVLTAIDGGEVTEFLAYTENDGKLMIAAQIADDSFTNALHAIRELGLEGSQRRFANKNAIAVSDAAINMVDQTQTLAGQLVTDLVRGVRTEHDMVKENQEKLAEIKADNFGLTRKLRNAQSSIKNCFEDANEKVNALAAIDKIGVV